MWWLGLGMMAWWVVYQEGRMSRLMCKAEELEDRIEDLERELEGREEEAWDE